METDNGTKRFAAWIVILFLCRVRWRLLRLVLAVAYLLFEVDEIVKTLFDFLDAEQETGFETQLYCVLSSSSQYLLKSFTVSHINYVIDVKSFQAVFSIGINSSIFGRVRLLTNTEC